MPPKRWRNPDATSSNSFLCNCEKLCRGQWTPLPRSTFYKHKKYRKKAPEFVSLDPDESEPVRSCREKESSNIVNSDFEFAPDAMNIPLPNSTPHVLESPDPPEIEINDYNVSSPKGSNFNPGPVVSGQILDSGNCDERSWGEGDLAADLLESSDIEFEIDYTDFQYEQMHNRDSRSPDSEYLDEYEGSTGAYLSLASGEEESAVGSMSIADLEERLLHTCPQIPELNTAMSFILKLRTSRLEATGLTSSQIAQLRIPGPPPPFDENASDFFSLKQYLATFNTPERVYNSVSTNYNVRHPETPMLSFDEARKTLEERSGVYGISTNMCINSCMAFSGPFANLEKCTFCGSCQYYPQTRKKSRKPLRQFYSIPIGPQIQALWKNCSTAEKMHYRRKRTSEIIATRTEKLSHTMISSTAQNLEAVKREDIRPNDTVLMFAMDGAQPYPDKPSDTWVCIFTLLELSPKFRFLKKHVMVASCIPDPQKPKHFDSFLFPTFQHIAAINNDGGLRIWDAITNITFSSRLFCFLNTADGPGSIYITGLAGYHGAFPCRLFCGIKGRHKPRIPIYYPALLKPRNYVVTECSHGDVDCNQHVSTAKNYYQQLEFLLGSTSQTNYKQRRKLTGISKPPLIFGLNLQTRLPLFSGLSGDAMHVTTLNLGELLPPLWIGTFSRYGTDNNNNWDWAVFRDGSLWQEHGKRIAECKPHIPSSFDHPHLAEKINSGYKEREWQNYFLGLAPALLFHILPVEYWTNFCKLIRAIKICTQYSITTADLLCAQRLMDDFVTEFEILYIRRRVDRLHFARPCIHTIWHLGLETARLGPSCLYAAWTMERTIGNLGEEIRSDSQPYANLMERCLLRCQINTIKILYTELDFDCDSIPYGSVALGDGYLLLRARERNAHVLDPAYLRVVRTCLALEGFQIQDNFSWKFQRWARLSLPNGQIARSAWKELARKDQNVRCLRNVKFRMNGKTRFGEVNFYLHIPTAHKNYGFALIHTYSLQDEILYKDSFGTVICVQKPQGEDSTYMTSIESVISAQPWPEYGRDCFFIWERSGIALSYFGGSQNDHDDD